MAYMKMNPPKKKQKLSPKKKVNPILSPQKNHLRLNKNKQWEILAALKDIRVDQPTGPRSVESLTWISFPGSGGLKKRRMNFNRKDVGKLLEFFVPNLE